MNRLARGGLVAAGVLAVFGAGIGVGDSSPAPAPVVRTVTVPGPVTTVTAAAQPAPTVTVTAPAPPAEVITKAVTPPACITALNAGGQILAVTQRFVASAHKALQGVIDQDVSAINEASGEMKQENADLTPAIPVWNTNRAQCGAQQ